MPRILAPAALLTTALVLTACGGSSSDGAAEPDPAVLYGKAFTVDEMTIGGSAVEPVSGSAIVITTLEDSVSANAGCNTMNGEATYTSTQITVGPIAMTMMACEPALMEQDLLVGTFLEGDPLWSLDGEVLTLTVGADSMVLRSS